MTDNNEKIETDEEDDIVNMNVDKRDMTDADLEDVFDKDNDKDKTKEKDIENTNVDERDKTDADLENDATKRSKQRQDKVKTKTDKERQERQDKRETAKEKMIEKLVNDKDLMTKMEEFFKDNIEENTELTDSSRVP